MGAQPTLVDAVDRMAAWNPGKYAVIQAEADRAYTYEGFVAAAERAARCLRALGVDDGDRVAFLNRPIVEQAVVYHGALLAGAIPAPIHRREAPNTIAALLADVSPRVLWYQREFEDLVSTVTADLDPQPELVAFSPEHDGPPLGFDVDSDADESLPGHDVDADESLPDHDVDADESLPDHDVGVGESLPGRTIDPSSDAFIVHTSGTTGRPKGIVHTHEEAVASAELAHALYRSRRSDVALNHYTPSFVSWHLNTYSFLAAGATVVYMAEWDPSRVPAVMERHGVTYWLPVATQWKQVMQAGVDGYDLSSVERVGSGGESLNIELVSEIRERVAADFIQLYAMTESMLSGCGLFPEEITSETIASVGKPITGVDCRIVDPVERDPNVTVQEGETGEILLRGPSIAERVWDDPERTEKLFHEDGWLYTGDLGHRDEEGFLHIDGRWDNMLISGGINVYPEGVEDVLETHPDVAECAIVGRDDDDWGEALHACVVPATGSLTPEALDAWCKASDDLADYSRPRSYEFVDDLPRTTSGKLDHAELRRRDPDPDWPR